MWYRLMGQGEAVKVLQTAMMQSYMVRIRKYWNNKPHLCYWMEEEEDRAQGVGLGSKEGPGVDHQVDLSNFTHYN